MSIKKIVLLGSIGALLLLVLLGVGEAKLGLVCSYETNQKESYSGGFIPGGNGDRYPDIVYFKKAEWCEPLAFALMPFLPLFFLSLLTYFMHDRIFRAWWNFARWMVPVIIVTTIFFETRGERGGGWGISSGMDEFVILWLLYIILIITSLWKIVSAYDKTKK